MTHEPYCSSILTGGQDPCDCAEPEDIDDAEVTRQLRSLGSILTPVSPEQRKQLDMLVGMQPTTKKRRLKKSERTKRRKG
ncbi:MAG: hypothetical protein A2Y38_19995 [Spirochaetes bacterium GWB1_59_5]|nr:MAG: hypothetical protein A2Y38_19995 [Spirochaetes bacterium GWB1_59_5]